MSACLDISFLVSQSHTEGCQQGMILQAWRISYLPEEEPLSVVEQADDSSNDDGTLCIVWHVLEDRRQDQQDNHDQQACTTG